MGKSFRIGEIVYSDELDSGIIQSCADKASAMRPKPLIATFTGIELGVSPSENAGCVRN